MTTRGGDANGAATVVAGQSVSDTGQIAPTTLWSDGFGHRDAAQRQFASQIDARAQAPTDEGNGCCRTKRRFILPIRSTTLRGLLPYAELSALEQAICRFDKKGKPSHNEGDPKTVRRAVLRFPEQRRQGTQAKHGPK